MQCHISMSLSNVIDFNLVFIYVFLIRFSLCLCVSDSIFSNFFNNWNIFFNLFFIRLKLFKYKYFYKIKYWYLHRFSPISDQIYYLYIVLIFLLKMIFKLITLLYIINSCFVYDYSFFFQNRTIFSLTNLKSNFLFEWML